MCAGMDGYIYFGASHGTAENARLYRWNPRIPQFEEVPYPQPGNPQYWTLDDQLFPDAVRIRSLCTDVRTGWIYGGTGGGYNHLAHLFRQEWSKGGGGSQTARTGEAHLPFSLVLCQNDPNPFARTTDIRCQLPGPTRVTLTVYDICGRLVRMLADENHRGGEYVVTWDGRDASGKKASPGMYFYRLEAAGLVETRKLTLLR